MASESACIEKSTSCPYNANERLPQRLGSWHPGTFAKIDITLNHLSLARYVCVVVDSSSGRIGVVELVVRNRSIVSY